MTLYHVLALSFFPLIMVFAAFSDMFTMTISNRLSLALVAGFIVMSLMQGFTLEQYLLHFLAGFVVLSVTFGFFAMGWMGGGDAKLASSTALWFGFSYLLDYTLLASVLGGGLTLGLLAARQMPMPSFFHSQGWLLRLHDEKTGIPYGIALSAAALIVYQNTFWLK